MTNQLEFWGQSKTKINLEKINVLTWSKANYGVNFRCKTKINLNFYLTLKI